MSVAKLTKSVLQLSAIALLAGVSVGQAHAGDIFGQIVKGVVQEALKPQQQPPRYTTPQQPPRYTTPQQPPRYTTPQQPGYTTPPQYTYPQPTPGYPYNPEIYNSGKQITNVVYDPFTGRYRVTTTQNKVRESALDPNRRYADPGSIQQVNEYQTDAQGRQWHVTGTRWTTNGVPHGNLSRRRVSSGGGIDHDERENVVFSAPNSNVSQSNRTNGNQSNRNRTTNNKSNSSSQPRKLGGSYSPF